MTALHERIAADRPERGRAALGEMINRAGVVSPSAGGPSGQRISEPGRIAGLMA